MRERFSIEDLALPAPDKAALINFVESWFDHQNPVLFAGAGLPKHNSVRKADLPRKSEFSDWQELLKDFRKRLSAEDSKIEENLPGDALRLAQVFQVHVSRAHLLDVLAQHVPSDDFEPGIAYKKLIDIPWHAIVTTNYDDLLERAFQERRSIRRVIWDADLTQRRSPNDLPIIKMHGDLQFRDSIIITEDDYRTYDRKRPGMAVKIRQLLTEHPLLFVGFGFSDPNAGAIDGWIRDTIHHTRLPALALTHGDKFPSEEQMWKERGIHMIRLSGRETLERVIEALWTHTQGHSRRRKPIGQFSLLDIDRRISEVVKNKDADSTWTHKVAAILVSVVNAYGPLGSWVDGIGTNDEDASSAASEAERYISRFCYGNLVYQDQETKVDHWAIFKALEPGPRKQLLQIALRTGTRFLFLKGPNERLDAAQLFLDEFGASLTNDEKAQLYFYRGRSYRRTNEISLAKADLVQARELAASKELRSAITIDLREVLFADGDAEGLNRELARPLDTQDVFTLCRRGSDALVLSKSEEAYGYYSQALDRARTEDERYVALWGIQASVWSDSPQVSSEEADRYWNEARDIRPELRPKTEALFKLVERAGQSWLNGERRAAISILQRYLDQARRLGWPLTTRHRVTFPIESAASQTVRLLLSKDEGGTPTQANDIKEALTIMMKFGLDKQVERTLKGNLLIDFAKTSNNRIWYQKFISERKGIYKQDGVRQVCALSGIPILDDEYADSQVETLVKATVDTFSADTPRQELPELLDLSWKILSQHGEHLTERAVLNILSVLPFGERRRSSIICHETGVWPWGTWRREGFLTGSVAARKIKKVALDITESLRQSELKRDWIYRRHIFRLCRDLNKESLFSAQSKKLIIDKLRLLILFLESEPDRTNLLEAVGLMLDMNSEEPILRKQTGAMLNLHSTLINSTMFPYWIEVMTGLVPLLDDTQAKTLADLAKAEVERNDSWSTSPTATARLLQNLTSHRAGLRQLGGNLETARLILRLGERNLNALAFMRELKLPRGSTLLTEAVQRLCTVMAAAKDVERRVQAVNTISWWCYKLTHRSKYTDTLIQGLSKLLQSDTHQVRYNATQVFMCVPRPVRGPYLAEVADLILSSVLQDPEWDVRAVGAVNLGAVWRDTAWAERAKHEARRLLDDPVAAVRRFAAVALSEF